jgi:hypothetical protein
MDVEVVRSLTLDPPTDEWRADPIEGHTHSGTQNGRSVVAAMRMVKSATRTAAVGR